MTIEGFPHEKCMSVVTLAALLAKWERCLERAERDVNKQRKRRAKFAGREGHFQDKEMHGCSLTERSSVNEKKPYIALMAD